MAALLPASRQFYGPQNSVVNIDVQSKTVTLKSGRKITYGSMLSTMPLDVVLRGIGKADVADGLTHSSSHIVGVGIRGPSILLSCFGCADGNVAPQGPARTARSAGCISRRTTAPSTGTSLRVPFHSYSDPFWSLDLSPPLFLHRSATVFSLYAKDNCPADGAVLPTLCLGDGTPPPAGATASSGPYWSLMFEVSESKLKPVNQETVPLGGATHSAVVLDCLIGAIATTLLTAEHEVVSLYHRRLEHGYPTPSLGRDAALAASLPGLRAAGIWSRGRFGSYKYEVANQDHSLMLGVEAADNIVAGTLEATLNHPNVVNGMRNTELLYKTG